MIFRLDFPLANPLLAFYFFLSYLILLLALALSGPLAAAILCLFSSTLALYVSLSAKEPSLFLQPLFYGAFFILMLGYLQVREKSVNDKSLLKERLLEEMRLVQANALKKQDLQQALQKKIDRFLNLHEFSARLKDRHELEKVADLVVQEVWQVFGKADECLLYLVDEAKQGLLLLAAVRRDRDVVKEKEGSVFERWAMKRAQAVVVEDVENDFRFPVERRESKEWMRSVCASPLMTEKKVLGVLRVGAAKPLTFQADDLRLLDIFSSLAAVNLRNILLYEKMGELAIRDSLTGLYLNRYFQERLSEEIKRAAGNDEPFSLILFDIDHFKRTNDEYGHAAGDLVLRGIATLLSGCLGPSDLAARYGGEEFVVLLPRQHKKTAIGVAERLRSRVEQNRFSLRRFEGSVTVSLGVSAFPEDGRTKEELLWKADKNLYEAKRGGRNQVCGKF